MTATPVRVASGSPFESEYGFCRAVRVDDRVLVAGTAPIWPDGACPEDPGTQARRCFEIIAGALGEAGADFAHVVRTRMYIVDVGDAPAIGAVHGALFAGARPTATMVVVAGLLDPRWRVEIEAEAVVSSPVAGGSTGTAGSGPEATPPPVGMVVYFTDQWARKRYRGERFVYHVMRDCPSGKRIKREHRRSAELPLAGRKPCVECSVLAAAWLGLPTPMAPRTSM